MKKVLKWAVIIFVAVTLIGTLMKGGDLASETKLTKTENGKKVFNDLGWKLYSSQFVKPLPESSSQCFKDMETCPYWEEVAGKFNAKIPDVKFVLYSASNVALTGEQQKMYDEFHTGLESLSSKTDENAQQYLAEFAQKKAIEEYELRAIITKGDLFKIGK